MKATSIVRLAALSCLAAVPAHADTVNVYTERQPVFLENIFGAFTEQTGVDVEVLYLDKGSVERLRNEGRHSPADVVIVADVGRLLQLAENELVKPIESAEVERTVSPNLRHPDGLWSALTQRFRVAYVANDSPIQELTFEELGDPGFGQGICLRSGTHPYNVALFSAYADHHGVSEAEKWLKGIKGNLARKPQGNDRAQIKGVASGACDVAVANLYYFFKMINGNDSDEREAASKVRWVPISFADGGLHANVSGVALAKHAPNTGLAIQLIEFMVGENAQRIYASDNYELPVRDGVGMPPELQRALAHDVDQISLANIARHRPEVSEIVGRVGFDD